MTVRRLDDSDLRVYGFVGSAPAAKKGKRIVEFDVDEIFKGTRKKNESDGGMSRATDAISPSRRDKVISCMPNGNGDGDHVRNAWGPNSS